MSGPPSNPLSSTRPADFVILGGGTCGCWLAAELIERFGFHVMIIESGVENAGKWDGVTFGRMALSRTVSGAPVSRQPAKWIRELGGSQDWQYRTDAGKALAGRKMMWPRGRGMGGSSRINAMIWTPPTHQDLQALHQAGGDRWSPGELREAFQRAERLVIPETPRFQSDSTCLFLQAANRFASQPDSVHQPCVYQRTNRRGRRWTAADRLAEMQDKDLARLQCVRASVRTLTLDGSTVRAVELDAGGKSHSVTARHGVILCTGAIASPALLQCSGIGNGEALEQAGIRVEIENPGVGMHLKDHLLMPVIYQMKNGRAFPGHFSPRDLARWTAIGRGPVVSNLAEAGGLFDDSRIQLHVTPTHYLTYPRKMNPPSMTLGVNLTRPQSTGRVTVSDGGMVRIEPNYLGESPDLDELIRAVGLAREIAATEPLASALVDEHIPGPRFATEERLASAIARYSQTLYHPVGTCAMGRVNDRVVDNNLRLRNVDRLWVVDASVLPEIPTTNPTGTLLALVTHAASLIQKFVSTKGIP